MLKQAISALSCLALVGCLGTVPARDETREDARDETREDARDETGESTVPPVVVSEGAVLVDVVQASASDPDIYVSAGESGWGKLALTRSGAALSPVPGLPLQVGDEIETQNVIVALRYGPQVEVYVMPYSRIRVGSIFVKFGEIWVRITGALKEKFKVETEFVTAGVEGTEFVVRAGRDGSMAVDVHRGKVLCTSKQGKWTATRLVARDSFKVMRGVPPIKAKLALTDLQRARLQLQRVDAAVRVSPNLIRRPSSPTQPNRPTAPVTTPRQPSSSVEPPQRVPSRTVINPPVTTSPPSVEPRSGS